MSAAGLAALVERPIPTTIPWWMGAAMVLVWMAAVAGMVLIVRRRWRSRRPVPAMSESDTRALDGDRLPVTALPAGTPLKGLPSGVSPRDRGGSANRPPEAGR